MKKLELYQCEVCGTQYASKSDCADCEKCHQKSLSIVSSRYLPYTMDKSGMPTTITLRDSRGKEYIYKR